MHIGSYLLTCIFTSEVRAREESRIPTNPTIRAISVLEVGWECSQVLEKASFGTRFSLVFSCVAVSLRSTAFPEYFCTMDLKKLQEFMELIGRLKHMKRTGWVIRNIPEPETIAGHMYRMAILSLLVDNKENLDQFKIMQMSLIHDLAECIVGDITPHCGVPADVKHRLEDEAMEEICKLLGDKGPMILEMFREYEKQESAEAKYVKDLDRLDLIMQAYEYEKRDNVPGVLEEFFVATNGKIRHPFINKLASEITATREAMCRKSSSSN